MYPINIYSAETLEKWDYATPWTTGIGGSETCHLELTERFTQKGHTVKSFCPLYEGKDYFGDLFKNSLDIIPNLKENYLIFRDPKFFDKDLHHTGNYLFIAQDVDYGWTPAQLQKVTKYICLCQEHADYTKNRYPEIAHKVFISTNGIRREKIEEIEKLNLPRNPNKIIYASSPDRGLKLILENWFRVLEQVPTAELHVFYGLENMKTIAQKANSSFHANYASDIESLLNQKNVIWRGRIGQEELYKELFTSNVWFYPSDWPETSCISCMDVQGCGVVPVTNHFWAVGENVTHGYMFDDLPQKNNLTKLHMIDKVCELLNDPWDHSLRAEMMIDARNKFDWNTVVSQYEGWLI